MRILDRGPYVEITVNEQIANLMPGDTLTLHLPNGKHLKYELDCDLEPSDSTGTAHEMEWPEEIE